MKVHAEPKTLSRPLAGGKSGTTVTVEPMVAGTVEWPPGFFERPGGRLEPLRVYGIGVPRSKWERVPCPAFLIRHPGAGPVLVDTGLHPSIASKPSANMGRVFTRMSRPRLEPGADVPARLRDKGLDAKGIRTVVMTHLHYDHSSAISEFPNAVFVLSEAEWEDATTESRPLLRGYRPEHYDYVFDYRTVNFNRVQVSSYGSFGRTFDLFGDGSVRLAFTPGHSAGHMSVIARLSQRDFVIAGDTVYTMRQLEGGPEPARPHDPHTWKRSLQELQLFRREYPDAVVVPSHDVGVVGSLDERYE
jgi:glyoxylase-like metal-dependent hydrolase (beta-lactamase superfamily II)